MIELLQPYIIDILLALVSVLVTAIIGAIALLQRKVSKWINGKNNLQDQEYLMFLSDQAFSFIENTMKDAHSQAKLNEAFRYVSERLEMKNINISTNDIRAAIEKAVLEFNKNK